MHTNTRYGAVVLQLSPRVCVYDDHTEPPQVPSGSLAFPQTVSAAFGDGRHPTTRLCAGAVDVMSRRSKRVLDVGTGTGILARIARARGALLIVGTDIDAYAREVASANVLLDPPDAVPIIIEDASPQKRGPVFDLVVANILQLPLLSLAPALIGALAPRGTLLLSGFTSAETPQLRNAYASLLYRGESKLDGWSLLAFEARDP